MFASAVCLCLLFACCVIRVIMWKCEHTHTLFCSFCACKCFRHYLSLQQCWIRFRCGPWVPAVSFTLRCFCSRSDADSIHFSVPCESWCTWCGWLCQCATSVFGLCVALCKTWDRTAHDFLLSASSCEADVLSLRVVSKIAHAICDPPYKFSTYCQTHFLLE